MEFTTTITIDIKEYFDNLYKVFDENLVCDYEYSIFEKGYEDFEDLIEWCKSMNINPYAQDKDDRFILLIWFNSFLF